MHGHRCATAFDADIDAIVAFLESRLGEERLFVEPDIPEMELLPMARN